MAGRLAWRACDAQRREQPDACRPEECGTDPQARRRRSSRRTGRGPVRRVAFHRRGRDQPQEGSHVYDRGHRPRPRRLEPAMTHLPHAGDPRNGNPPNRPARMTADHKASATTVQQRCPPLPANVPNNPPHDGANPAKPRQNPAIPPISRTPPIEHVVRADAPAVSRRKLHPAGRWSSLGCPHAGSRRPPSASWPPYRT